MQSKTLYLSSNREWLPDQIIRPPSAERFPLGAKVEGILERGRPENAVPRTRCICLHDDENIQTGAAYRYRVVPIGFVEKGHTGWLSMVAQHADADWIALHGWVTSYWRQDECIHREGSWEYRAERVRVIDRRR